MSLPAVLAAEAWRDRRRTYSRLTIAALLLAICACQDTTPQHAIDVLVTERFTAGRLADRTTWRRCILAQIDSLVPRARCGDSLVVGTRPYNRITELERNLSGRTSPPGLRAAALLELRTADTSQTGIGRAVGLLERAERLAPNDSKVLNDLAVAYLELGQRDQQLASMLRALDAVERALENDSTSTAALFNRALILERLYLTATAARAWSHYLTFEKDARWREEANEHLTRLASDTLGRASSKFRSLTDSGAARPNIDSLVARAPSDARNFAFRFLEEWGVALRSGQRAHADSLLATVREIARAFDALDLDRSIPLAVHAIDSDTADSGRVAQLANAHIDLQDGIDFQLKGSNDSAIVRLSRAERTFRRLESAAAGWAAYWDAASETSKAHYAKADQILDGLLLKTTPQEPVLRGRAVWVKGTNQLRQGNYEEAIQQYRAARDTIARTREPEYSATISYLLTEVLELAGQSAQARVEAFRGLKGLAPFRRTDALNNHLTNVALLARRQGFGRAGLAIMQEVLHVAPHLAAAPVAWAQRAYARELMMLGRIAAARAALDSANRWIDRIPAGNTHDRVRADVQLVSAQLTRRDDPRRARDTLSAVIDAYTSLKLPTHLPEARYEKSLADRDAGDVRVARQTLDSAIGMVVKQSGTFTNPETRATFSETVENLFDEMMEMQLAANRRDSAFVYLERGRQAAWSRAATGDDPPSLNRIRPLLPAGTLVVEYAVLQKQLVIWAASKDTSWSRVEPITRDSITALVDRAIEIEEMDNTAADSASASARLFDLLIRQPGIDSQTIQSIAIIPDRDLSRLPFAALWDTAKRKYLVERFMVRTAPSASFLKAALSRHGATPTAGEALIVGDPTLDRSTVPLPQLPGARQEAKSVATIYSSRRLLTDTGAKRDAVLALLPTSSVFHFAGHAIFNADQPGRSYLALASNGSGDPHGGMLRADEIGELHPSKLQLVVLSACSTLNPRPSHTGAIAGLAYSFLRAGVPATVSTLWDVSDAEVGTLLVDFHRQLVKGTPAAEALQSAQLAAIGRRSPPRAWAAFIYTGP